VPSFAATSLASTAETISVSQNVPSAQKLFDFLECGKSTIQFHFAVTEMPVPDNADVGVQPDMLPQETVVLADDSLMTTKVFYGRKRAAAVKGFEAAEHQSERQVPKRQRKRPIRFQ